MPHHGEQPRSYGAATSRSAAPEKAHLSTYKAAAGPLYPPNEIRLCGKVTANFARKSSRSAHFGPEKAHPRTQVRRGFAAKITTQGAPERLTIGIRSPRPPALLPRNEPSAVPVAAPEKAHLWAKSPIKRRGLPEKPHLSCLPAPAMPHRASETPRQDDEIEVFRSSRKASPLVRDREIDPPRYTGLQAVAAPEKPHPRERLHNRHFLNPLTILPDSPHGYPRTPSRLRPVKAHLTSRKPSLNRAESLVQ